MLIKNIKGGKFEKTLVLMKLIKLLVKNIKGVNSGKIKV